VRSVGGELIFSPFGDAAAWAGGGCGLRGYVDDGFWVQRGGGGELVVGVDAVEITFLRSRAVHVHDIVHDMQY